MGEDSTPVKRSWILINSDPEPAEMICLSAKFAVGVTILLRLLVQGSGPPNIPGGLVATLSANAPLLAVFLITVPLLHAGAILHDIRPMRVICSGFGVFWWTFSVILSASLVGLDARVGLFYVLLCASAWVLWRLARPHADTRNVS